LHLIISNNAAKLHKKTKKTKKVFLFLEKYLTGLKNQLKKAIFVGEKGLFIGTSTRFVEKLLCQLEIR